MVGRRSAYGALTLSGAPFQAPSATSASSFSPALQPRARLDAPGLGWPPFARRYSGGHSCFPLLRLLGCFGSPGSPPQSCGCRASSAAGCPIRTPADPWLLAPPRGLSRPAASFLASGSHRHPPCALSRLSLARVPARASAHASLVCLRAAPPGARVLCVFLSSHPVKEPCGGLAPASVENVGLEPTTPGLQSRCSSQLSQSPIPPMRSPGQTRTADPHIISVVL